MVSIISRVARTASWEDIVEFGSLASGDIIVITLKNEERVDLEVAHDESGQQFFVFRDCLKVPHKMNALNTNRGGWRDCQMRQYAEDIFNLLPDDLQAVIVPTKIVQCIKGERIECEDKLFCLSYTQVFGKKPVIQDMEPEDSQLDIYKTRRNRIKGWGANNNDHSTWWLRSPYTDYTTSFYLVYLEGYDTNYYAGYSNGVCFGFCIKS